MRVGQNQEFGFGHFKVHGLIHLVLDLLTIKWIYRISSWIYESEIQKRDLR